MLCTIVVIRCNNLQVYQPRLTAEDVQNGWRSLGQSLDPSKVLIVKESPFNPNALSKIDSVKISWRSRHLFVRTIPFFPIRIHPLMQNNSIRTFFVISLHPPRNTLHSGQFSFEDHFSGNRKRNTRRAVILVQYEPTCSLLHGVRTSRYVLTFPSSYLMPHQHLILFLLQCRGGKGKGSLWPIVPVKRDGAETTINLGMFQVGAGSQSPGTILGLKPDSIEILNP
jgi:hypothetical protein